MWSERGNAEHMRQRAYEIRNIRGIQHYKRTRRFSGSAIGCGETRAEMPLFCCKGLVSRETRAKVPLICSNELVWRERRAEVPLICTNELVSRERRAELPLICTNELVLRKKGKSAFDLHE
ncbi:hypothetical protein BSK47_10275 [Paenibacillus odorifer]|uniref:Uncharacterized protein n=1 Tax=Paenibacillus odorifer TaxID=189426 RepID=A0AB36JHE4_9BACL|nr:hypothetical protein BSK47_10275 [Paenibacillus odorifer]